MCNHTCPGDNCAPDRCCEDCVADALIDTLPWAHPDTMIGKVPG